MDDEELIARIIELIPGYHPQTMTTPGKVSYELIRYVLDELEDAEVCPSLKKEQYQ
jgi:hypothetical protein